MSVNIFKTMIEDKDIKEEDISNEVGITKEEDIMVSINKEVAIRIIKTITKTRIKCHSIIVVLHKTCLSHNSNSKFLSQCLQQDKDKCQEDQVCIITYNQQFKT